MFTTDRHAEDLGEPERNLAAAVLGRALEDAGCLDGLPPAGQPCHRQDAVRFLSEASPDLRFWAEQLDLNPDAIVDRCRSRVGGSIADLTRREQEVCDALLGGAVTDAELAASLGITEGTVAVHMQHILRKFNVSNRCHLVLKLARNGQF